MSFKFSDLDDWFSKYSSQVDIEAYSQWMSVSRFYLGVGVLVGGGVIEPEEQPPDCEQLKVLSSLTVLLESIL